MRVGLVIYGSLDTISGGYLYDRKLVANLRAAGDTVEIFSLPWRNFGRHLTDNFTGALYETIARARLDILIQDELNHPSLIRLNQRLGRTVPYPIVSLVHHLRVSETHPRILKAIYRRVERAYLQSADAFIFNSETTRRAVYDLVPAAARSPNVVALPSGDHFHPDLTAQDITARAKDSCPLRVLFIGNIITRKGADTLLDALALLPRENFSLTIVGNRNLDAAHAARLDAKIRVRGMDNVCFAGALPDGELERVLRSSHVIAVPSEYEGYGVVYLEGMSFGLPALGTTAGAAREIITDGENGFLIAPHDARALASHLAHFEKDRAFLAKCGIAARARFLRQPGWEASMSHVRAALQAWSAAPGGA